MAINLETIRSSVSTPSQRIIAGGIVIAFCYFAASVVTVVLLSVLAAYFLDPLVEGMERLRLPRALGSLLVVILSVMLVAGLLYLVFDRAEHFANDWPRYSKVLRQASSAVEKRLQNLERGVSQITPAEAQPSGNIVRIEEDSPVRSLIVRGLGSIYSILLKVTFVPFLVFFMLAAKREVWHATLQLFPTNDRTKAKEVLDNVGVVLRSFVVGNVLVFLILALVSWVFFWLIGLEYPLLTGVISGLLNLVPYFGAVLAWVPPILIGMIKQPPIGWFLLVAGTLSTIHLLAMNVLIPALVGRRVRLNALAVTISLLFWGWMWGGIGLLLAIPITATLKVICDHIDSWKPVGRWLGS